MAVRYIVIPDGSHPGDELLRDADLPLAQALARQTDLTALTVRGARVWRNEVAAPLRGDLFREEFPALVATDLLGATGLDLQRVAAALPEGEWLEVRGPVNPSAVLLAERYDERWRATGDGLVWPTTGCSASSTVTTFPPRERSPSPTTCRGPRPGWWWARPRCGS